MSSELKFVPECLELEDGRLEFGFFILIFLEELLHLCSHFGGRVVVGGGMQFFVLDLEVAEVERNIDGVGILWG